MTDYDWQMPSAERAMARALDSRVKRLHTALPGRVLSFDPQWQTASVQPLIDQVLVDGTRVPLPVLADVPVQFPRGGGFVLTFPVRPGDECLLLFNERCIDGWWQSGEPSEPLDYRQHDLSDAVAIMGIELAAAGGGGFRQRCHGAAPAGRFGLRQDRRQRHRDHRRQQAADQLSRGIRRGHARRGRCGVRRDQPGTAPARAGDAG